VARFDQPIEPMTLDNMCELGVRSLFVSCWQCHRQAELSADRGDVDYAHHVFSPCRHHAAARFSGVSTPLASARIIHVKPHQSATQPPWM
jgi:hypothetical protein